MVPAGVKSLVRSGHKLRSRVGSGISDGVLGREGQVAVSSISTWRLPSHAELPQLTGSLAKIIGIAYETVQLTTALCRS